MEEVHITSPRELIFGMAAGPHGAPLVLGLHGWSQRNGWHTWQPMMEPLAAAGYRVVCIDMPGWGKSLAWSAGPIGDAEALEAVTTVIDASGAPAAVLMGKSWGGGIAIKMALESPARVSKLVLSAPAYREPAKLAGLRQPALLAWAKDDQVIPYRYASHYIEAAPNATLVTYDTGGHSAGPKNAKDFARRVIQFLAQEQGT